jgi:hypothetical protein
MARARAKARLERMHSFGGVLFFMFCCFSMFRLVLCEVRLAAGSRNLLHRDLHGCQRSDCSDGGGFAMG